MTSEGKVRNPTRNPEVSGRRVGPPVPSVKTKARDRNGGKSEEKRRSGDRRSRERPRLLWVSDVRGLEMGNCDLVIFFGDDCELAGVGFYFDAVADGGAVDCGGEDANAFFGAD
jgi:hypothetical protein